MSHIAQQEWQRIQRLRQWPVICEKGEFIGSRVFTKNNSVCVARCMLCAAGGVAYEICVKNLDVRDLTHARDPSGLVGEHELICTAEYFYAFISIMEASGFVRRAANVPYI